MIGSTTDASSSSGTSAAASAVADDDGSRVELSAKSYYLSSDESNNKRLHGSSSRSLGGVGLAPKTASFGPLLQLLDANVNLRSQVEAVLVLRWALQSAYQPEVDIVEIQQEPLGKEKDEAGQERGGATLRDNKRRGQAVTRSAAMKKGKLALITENKGIGQGKGEQQAALQHEEGHHAGKDEGGGLWRQRGLAGKNLLQRVMNDIITQNEDACLLLWDVWHSGILSSLPLDAWSLIAEFTFEGSNQGLLMSQRLAQLLGRYLQSQSLGTTEEEDSKVHEELARIRYRAPILPVSLFATEMSHDDPDDVWFVHDRLLGMEHSRRYKSSDDESEQESDESDDDCCSDCEICFCKCLEKLPGIYTYQGDVCRCLLPLPPTGLSTKAATKWTSHNLCSSVEKPYMTTFHRSTEVSGEQIVAMWLNALLSTVNGLHARFFRGTWTEGVSDISFEVYAATMVGFYLSLGWTQQLNVFPETCHNLTIRYYKECWVTALQESSQLFTWSFHHGSDGMYDQCSLFQRLLFKPVLRICKAHKTLYTHTSEDSLPWRIDDVLQAFWDNFGSKSIPSLDSGSRADQAAIPLQSSHNRPFFLASSAWGDEDSLPLSLLRDFLFACHPMMLHKNFCVALNSAVREEMFSKPSRERFDLLFRKMVQRNWLRYRAVPQKPVQEGSVAGPSDPPELTVDEKEAADRTRWIANKLALAEFESRLEWARIKVYPEPMQPSISRSVAKTFDLVLINEDDDGICTVRDQSLFAGASDSVIQIIRSKKDALLKEMADNRLKLPGMRMEEFKTDETHRAWLAPHRVTSSSTAPHPCWDLRDGFGLSLQ